MQSPLGLASCLLGGIPAAVAGGFRRLSVAFPLLLSMAVAQIPEAETRISFLTETTRVDERESFIWVEVRRAGDLSMTSAVHYATEDGTAVGGTHFTHATGTRTFSPGSDAVMIPVFLLPNSVPSEDLVFGLRLSDASAPAIIAPTSLHQITIVDDDKPGRFHFALEASEWNETAGSARVQIIREGGLAGPVSVNYRAVSGTAIEGADFPATTGTVTLPEGQTRRVVSIPIHNDPFLEANETFTIVLENPTGGATIGEPATHTVTLVSDDAPATVAFAGRGSVVAESRPAAEVVVRRTGDPSQEVSVFVRSVSVEARENMDYAPFSGLLTFGPGVTERTITIPIVQDSLTEEPERFLLALSAPSHGAILGAEANHEFCIVSDDGPARISFMPGVTTTTESPGSVAVRLVRSGNVSHWASVKLLSVDDSAHAGRDFAEVNHVIEFNTGTLVREFSIPLVNDSVAECTEKFVLELQAREGDVALGEHVRRTVEILDDEPATIFFLTRHSTTSEGGASVQVEVGRVGNLSTTTTVVVSAEGRSATAGADFQFAPVTLSFEPGITQRSVSVSALADVEQEFGESFELVLGPPSSWSSNRHHVTIVDPDPPAFLHGSYHGLVESEGSAVGAVSLKISTLREITGTLQTPWKTYRFRARMGRDGTFSRHFPAPAQQSHLVATLTLELSADGSTVHGTVTWGSSALYSVLAKRDKASRAQVPETGYYTAHLEGIAASTFGFLQIRVQANGQSIITGMLPTNRRITASGRIAEDGTMGIYFANPIGDSLIGWSRFDPNDGMRLSGNLTGDVRLVLPDINTGYTDSVTVAGARYRPVEKGRILDDFRVVEGEATMEVELEGVAPLQVPFTWGTANLARFARPNTARASLHFNPENGRWTGLFRHPNGREMTIRGICVQNAGAGEDIAAGYYFGGYHSYGVRLVPRQR